MNNIGSTSNQLANLILKGGSSNMDRDSGFCSDEDLDLQGGVRSPTDASEDSVEVKVTPISLKNKNKRKSAEPLRIISQHESLGPIKKRILYDNYNYKQPITTEEYDYRSKEYTKIGDSRLDGSPVNPFRPWSVADRSEQVKPTINPAEVYAHHPGLTTLHRSPDFVHRTEPKIPIVQEEPLSLVSKKQLVTPPEHSMSSSSYDTGVPAINYDLPSTSKGNSSSGSQKEQRNYKNMTRERRIEANARERTRVHTISAAFDTLRKSIPAYSHNQKLSKLSVLRIACSYILTLSRIVGEDYSADRNEPSLAECIDLVSKTIQTEGKLRKKKDE